MEEFLKTLQESALPAVWSRGVALSREAGFHLDSELAAPEIIIRVLLKNRPVHPRVTLWPAEGDAFCDCGDRNDPCLHIVAAALAFKNGSFEKTKAEAKEFFGIAYRFISKDRNLDLERFVCSSRGELKLEESLVSFIGGVQSGRISHPSVATTREDFAIDTLLTQRSSSVRSVRVLDRASWAKLLGLLENAPVISLGGEQVRCSGQIFPLILELADELGGELGGRQSGYRLRRKVQDSIEDVFLQGVVKVEQSLRAAQDPELEPLMRDLIKGPGTYFSEAQTATLLTEVLPTLQKKLTVEILTQRLPKAVEVLPRIALTIDKEGPDSISVVADLVYGDPVLARVRLDQKGALEILSRHEIPIRDISLEKLLLRDLQAELHLQPGQRIRMQGDQAAEFVRKHGKSDGSKEKSHTAVSLQAELGLSAEGEIAFQFKTPEGKSISGHEVMQAWKEGRSFFPISNGAWASLPHDWLSKYGEKILSLMDSAKDNLKIPPSSTPEFLDLMDELAPENRAAVPDYFLKFHEGLKDPKKIQNPVLPSDLKAELRAYQMDGVRWLDFLAVHRLGALLADDMGLGKTLQALCSIRGQTLVICPTSVLSAWSEQIRKFRPSLKPLLYHGPNRQLPKQDHPAQVILTTYGILRADLAILSERRWDSIVLDEAHTIKNPDSQIAQAVHTLATIAPQERFRVALSGTPIENRLDDLWSQFEFVNPGMLGSREEYQKRFAQPISRGNTQAQDTLRKKIKPFFLRRLKAEVAPELPLRTEVILQSELSAEERVTYDALLLSSRGEVLQKLQQDGNVFAALEALLRLRQLCCHPALVPGSGVRGGASSKTQLLIDTLLESIGADHRSLVFSQWTSLLDLLEPELTAQGIPFLRLDGSTTDREEVVKKFQSADGPPVFLLSLKAGGVGLTLTAADHVFILDPWWNPAVEDQAADRAHRLGQTQPVLIHRLVAKDTIEEKVLILQEEKRKLAQAVLSSDSSNPLAHSLTQNDILQLLAQD